MTSEEKIEDIPIQPEEATDLPLHVRQCVRRQVATVKEIRQVGKDTRALGYEIRRHIRQDRVVQGALLFMLALNLAKSLGVPVEVVLRVFGILVP